MSTRVWTCRGGASLSEPATLMWEHAVGLIPVVDEQGRLQGVITDRDIAMAAALSGEPLHQLKVDGSMTRDVATCGAGDPISSALDAMASRHVRRLPVVDGEHRVVGVISLHDLASRVDDAHHGRISAEQVTRALRSASVPREPAVRS